MSNNAFPSTHVIVLAAGQGKRMQSSLPKVLHEVLFRPMIHYVLDLAYSLSPLSVCAVVGHKEDKVREVCRTYPDVRFFSQTEQLGTGHAVKTVSPYLKNQSGCVVVLSGDVIMLRPETLSALVSQHYQSGHLCTVMTAHVQQPTGYGRMLRDAKGALQAIREEADCSPAERQIREVNCGIYCFDITSLCAQLEGLSTNNAQREYYLPDVVKRLVQEGKPVGSFGLEDPTEMTGINDRMALAVVHKLMARRVNKDWMAAGVTLLDPDTTWIDSLTHIEPDVCIEGGVCILNSRIETGARVDAGCRIENSRIGRNARVKQGSYLDQSEIGEEASVGPYAHLRPGSSLGPHVKVGNFVEVKKSSLGKGTKAAHLSYIGDADVGENVNLGCGFITCNFDGSKKHRTVIGDNVFVGSDSQTVAPVEIGHGSYIASGTTVTENVAPESLVLSRGRQVTKVGYARKFRKKPVDKTDRS